ncbi:hypothetical protein M9H77_36757 [Catharanthus roseus]|uniref:Uncharacterized protein n=1 Tax=Catharanthus roseus TaxID=4058 RepID=A0ACB9ZSP4_CATRO|nr:hypothetical protein M9H77_36757 [Catharanthus roseus]
MVSHRSHSSRLYLSLVSFGTGYHRWYQSSRVGSVSGSADETPIEAEAEAHRKNFSRRPHSPGHETEAMPESSSHGQTNTASHEIIRIS